MLLSSILLRTPKRHKKVRRKYDVWILWDSHVNNLKAGTEASIEVFCTVVIVIKNQEEAPESIKKDFVHG